MTCPAPPLHSSLNGGGTCFLRYENGMNVPPSGSPDFCTCSEPSRWVVPKAYSSGRVGSALTASSSGPVPLPISMIANSTELLAFVTASASRVSDTLGSWCGLRQIEQLGSPAVPPASCQHEASGLRAKARGSSQDC